MVDSELSDIQRQVLGRFFSQVEARDHADVYSVRKLPQEIRATLNGLYSRSRLSMRETFLRRLEKGLEEQGKRLEDLPLPAASEDVLSDVLVDKSGKFLRTYAIDHGHNSLREGAMLHLAVENVSQLVTRFLQRERRASFEESSTRYISFAKEGHWRDPEIIAAGEPWTTLYESALDESFSFYLESIELLQEHIRASRPRRDDEGDKAYARAVRAEAFDSARYLLTPAIYTKWGIVADARTVADLVTQLVSHPLAEFRIVGERIKQEAEREVPTLLTHARPNAYLQEQRTTNEEIAREIEALAPPAAAGSDAPDEGSARRAASKGQIDVRLLDAPSDLDSRLLASLLFEQSSRTFSDLYACVDALDREAQARLFARVLESRGSRDAMPDGLEGGGMLDFEVLVDFGAYRDIGRHRKGFQQQQSMTTQHGFVVPELFERAGLGKRYEAVLTSVAAKVEQLAERFPLQVQYLIPFAFLQRVRIQFDARQMAYFCELRSAPEGHFSYREVAIRMGHALAEVAPLYASFLRLCEETVFLGRVESEQGAEARRAQREARAQELGFET